MKIGLCFSNLPIKLSTPKSDLLTTSIDLSDIKSFKNPVKWAFLGSITTIFKSASSALLSANLIPFFSISSLDSLIPAVSEIILEDHQY